MIPSRSLIRPCSKHFAWTAICLIAALAGCSKSDTKPNPDAAPAPAVPQDASTSKPARPKELTIEQRLTEAESLAHSELDDAQEIVNKLKADPSKLNATETQRLAALELRLEEIRMEKKVAERAKHLADAEDAYSKGQLEQATAALETVLSAEPTAEQQTLAAELQVKIEQRRKVQRELRSAMRLLASENRGEVRAAKTQLWEEPEAAMPLLLEALKSDDKNLVGNTLEMLRALNQPEQTLPAMVAVLSRKEQAEIWPVAVSELKKMDHPGAGKPLLELALSAQDPAQRRAAREALTGAVDPPQNTLVELLPMLYANGPELAPALKAAYRSVIVHGQADLASRRGFDVKITPQEQEQLDGLSARLSEIAAEMKDGASSEAAQAALTLGVAMRRVTPQPLTGVTVSRAVGEDPSSPATAALDGVWNATAAPNMWRHPIDKPASIVLDLGAERMVTGVRIWNYNEPNVAYRGWKEVEIFVSSSPSLLDVVSEGIVVPASGAVDLGDYSVLLNVPFVRGRYIKLQPRSYWRPETMSGLTEIQILGF